MSSNDLRQSIACHVGRGQCSSSKHSYQSCDSVREALGIQSDDDLEDSILTGKISFLAADPIAWIETTTGTDVQRRDVARQLGDIHLCFLCRKCVACTTKNRELA
jgi:hypothetical protein